MWRRFPAKWIYAELGVFKLRRRTMETTLCAAVDLVSGRLHAAESKLPHVYLGYFVGGCRSLEYKGRFRPNEVLTPNGSWAPFLG